VEKGDTLQRIATAHGLSVEDLRANNPDIGADDIITIGQQLNLAMPVRWVNVHYTYQRSQEETVPFATISTQDSSKYTTYKKVTQKGVDGRSLIERAYTFLNGVLAEEKILNETVLVPSVDQLQVVGTRAVPVAPSASSAGTWRIPLPSGSYRISSKFGMRTLNGTTRMHKGVDMAAAKGTPIYAAMDGTVYHAGEATGYGLCIYLNHADGIQTRYAHCSKLLVKRGETVKAGQKIAEVGNTGVSTGPHLHFEVRINGEPVNPIR